MTLRLVPPEKPKTSKDVPLYSPRNNALIGWLTRNFEGEAVLVIDPDWAKNYSISLQTLTYAAAELAKFAKLEKVE